MVGSLWLVLLFLAWWLSAGAGAGVVGGEGVHGAQTSAVLVDG